MTAVDPDRGGVVVVRVWFEDGPDELAFRALVTSCVDLVGGRSESRAVTSPDAVVEVVRSRLVEILAGHRAR
ncbi:hypothetical protein RMN56_30490 [Micromonospora halotolerans]|uniref:Uncharacterized protein n=1 Tax=Micromonospora halotolerans TaxID=709879 RepID=A0ABY9ZW28_9ACTN|nr:hypothetical protein [Micromonospora halotolerans]WNM39389.1 hypothetical protein RMN56_30490 [Micromonospora halotolerans]